MRADKKYDIRGARYTIKKARIKDLGQCQSPKTKNPTIKLNSKLKGDDLLRVLIHEVGHACLWDLDEEAIDETSIIMAQVITDFFEFTERTD